MAVEDAVMESERSVVRDRVIGEVSSVCITVIGGIEYLREDDHRYDLYDIIKNAPNTGEITTNIRSPRNRIIDVNYVTRNKLENPDGSSDFSIPWETFVELDRPMRLERANLYTNQDSE